MEGQHQTADRALGEIASAAVDGVNVVAISSSAGWFGGWLWIENALRKDGWTYLGAGRWSPVPADRRDEWLTPIRGDGVREIVEQVGAADGASSRGGAAEGDLDELCEAMAASGAWMDAWSGPDGWARRHAARMEAVGRAIRMGAAVALRFKQENEMAKTMSRGLVLAGVTMKALRERAASVEVPPERYLELLFSGGEEDAAKIEDIVDRAIVAGVTARRSARRAAKEEPAKAEPGAVQPAAVQPRAVQPGAPREPQPGGGQGRPRVQQQRPA